MSHNERSQPQRVGTSSDRRCPQKCSASESDVSNENLFGNHSFGASTPMTRMAAQMPTVEQSLGVNETFSSGPTKKSVHIEIVAFTESRPVAFPSHVDSTLLSARLFPSPRRSASRDSCSPTSALGLAAFEPSSQAPPRLG